MKEYDGTPLRKFCSRVQTPCVRNFIRTKNFDDLVNFRLKEGAKLRLTGPKGLGKTTMLLGLAHYFKFIVTDRFTPLLLCPKTVSNQAFRTYLQDSMLLCVNLIIIIFFREYESANLDDIFESIVEVVAFKGRLIMLDIGTVSEASTNDLELLLDIVLNKSSSFIIAYSSGSILHKNYLSNLVQLFDEVEASSSLIRFTSFDKEEAELFTVIYLQSFELVQPVTCIDPSPLEATQLDSQQLSFPGLEVVKVVTNLNPLLMSVFINALRSTDANFNSIHRFNSVLFNSLKPAIKHGKTLEGDGLPTLTTSIEALSMAASQRNISETTFYSKYAQCVSRWCIFVTTSYYWHTHISIDKSWISSLESKVNWRMMKN